MLATDENKAKFRHCPQVDMNLSFKDYKNIVYSALVSPAEKDLHPGWKVVLNAYKRARKLFGDYRPYPHCPYIVYDNRKEVALYGNVVAYVGNYKSKVMAIPTWGDLAKCADESIDIKKDTYHLFFEGFALDHEQDGIKYVELYFGS